MYQTDTIELVNVSKDRRIVFICQLGGPLTIQRTYSLKANKPIGSKKQNHIQVAKSINKLKALGFITVEKQ